MSILTIVTIAQALASNASNLHVVDSAADIVAALPNASLVNRVSVFSLNGNATLNAAMAEKLAVLGSRFALGATQLVVRDSLANMVAAANAGAIALATQRQVVDTAYNLLNAPANGFAHLTSVTLIGTPTLNVSQLSRLESLPGFGVDPSAHLTLADTLSAVGVVLANHPAWFVPVASLSVRLDGTSIGAYEAAQIAGLAGHGTAVSFAAGNADTTLHIAAAAHDLAANAAGLNVLAHQVGLTISVSNDGSAINAADAAALSGLADFAPAAHSLFVVDNAANIEAHAGAIFGHGFAEIVVSSGPFYGTVAQLLDPTLHLNPGVNATLGASATVNATQAADLTALHGFSVASEVVLNVVDSAGNLIGLAPWLAPATSITVTDSETLNAAGVAALAGLETAHSGHFSLGGHTVTVSDSAANLLGLAAPELALASSLVLATGQVVTASQLTGLAALGPDFSENGHAVTVSDSVAALLGLAAPALALASGEIVSQSASITAASATSLVALGNVSLANGVMLSVQDTAAQLLALPPSAAVLVTGTTLSQDASVDAAQATRLANLPDFATGGHTLTITDSTANLLALPQGVLALQVVETLPAGVITLTAAQAAGLVALGHFSAAGATITVADTVADLTAPANAAWTTIASATNVMDSAANLVAAANTQLLQSAGTVSLNGNAQISALQAGVLAGIPHFTDGLASLIVVDSAAAIAGAADAILQVANLAEINASTPINAAQADHLAALSSAGKLAFLGGTFLTVVDSFAALSAPANALGMALATHIIVADNGADLALAAAHDWGSLNSDYALAANSVVNATELATLAGLGGRFAENGHTLTLNDNIAAIEGLTAPELALLNGETISTSASISAPAAAILVALGGVSLANGVTLTVQDTAANLVALPGAVTRLDAIFALSADATVNVTTFSTLRDTLGVSTSGHVLTIADTAGNLLTLAGSSLSLAGAVELTTDATVNGADFLTLRDRLDVTTNGHALTISDTAANLLALSGSNLTLTSACVLNADATVSAAQALLLAGEPNFGTGGHALTISDNAANLLALPAQVQVLAGSLTLASDQTVNVAQLGDLVTLNKFTTGGHLMTVADGVTPLLDLSAPELAIVGGEVLDASSFVFAAEATALAALGHFSLGNGVSLDIQDTAANLLTLGAPVLAVASLYSVVANATVTAANFQFLRDTLHFSDAGHAIMITDSAANLLTLAGGDLSQAHSCNLSADATVNAQQATELAGEPAFSVNGHALTISDSAGNLLSLSENVQSLSGNLVLSASETVGALVLSGLASLGDEFSAGGHTITVSDTAAALLGLSGTALGLAAGEVLSQSAAVNAADATALVALPDFSLGNGAALTVQDTAANLLSLPESVLALASSYQLSADAGVNAAQFESLRDQLQVALNGHAITISDTAGNLLAIAGTNLSMVSQCVLSAAATVGAAQANTLAGEPNFSNGEHLLTVSDSAFNLLGLSNLALEQAGALTINGNQTIGASQLNGVAAFGTQFSKGAHTIAVSDTASALLGLAAPALALADSEIVNQSVVVDAAHAAMLVALGHLSLGNGVTLTVEDTAANLVALPQSITAVATAYELSANAIVNAQDFATLRDTLGVAASGHALAIVDTAANLLNLAGGNLTLASTCTLSANAAVNVAQALLLANEPGFSTGAHVLSINTSVAAFAADLGALQADFGGAAGHVQVTFTDQSPSLTVSAAAYQADQSIIDTITTPATVTVTGSSMAAAAIAGVLASDAVVAHVQITDSALNVIDNISALASLGNKLTVTLTDQTPLAAAWLPELLQLASVTVGVGVSDTGAQIAAAIEAFAGNPNPAVTFLDANGVGLSNDSVVSVAQLAALELLGGNLNLNGHAIYLNDSVAHLTASGAPAIIATAESANILSGIYIVPTNGGVTLNATNAVALLGTDSAATQTPPLLGGAPITFTVADSASNMAANYANLQALPISHFVVTSTAAVSDAVLADLQSLGATAGNGVTLSVHDSAATIIANAANQLAGSITPTAWILNANATLSENAAALLGALPSVSAGGYRITLALTGDTSISVADANALGNLHGALNLGGDHLLVAGSAATLGALSANALSLVVPELTDTFTNINALTQTSPLLGGTVTVSDAEAITASQAAHFMGLIASGSGPGINISSLSFAGQPEAVTGDIAALQGLTACSGWTGAPSIHSHFALTASDSVANLINGNNTSFLAGLQATTLGAPAVVNAADAESLAAISSQIHFSLGGQTLTLQDSAANLLAEQYADGVALATTVMLSGPAAVTAPQAEMLLSDPNFVLNTTLTIQDSSASLLDGTLASDIANSGDAAHIVVALAAPETLDADTAAALVALPGFSDTHNLTIADSSDYLLAAANISAEQMATAVTLAGDETVSANTVLRLSEVPHFTAGNSVLTLAGNDFADDATIKAIADLGTQFDSGGHSITLTADALDLTPTQYLNLTSVQHDMMATNGHQVSAMLVNETATDLNNVLSVTTAGVAGASVNIYDSAGNLLSSQTEAQSGFTVTAADGGVGHTFSITETVNGTESAPVVVLEASTLEAAVSNASAQFASSGEIQVDSGKYLNLYTTATVPQNLQMPALVYNAAAHTISLDIPNAAPVVLITLGATTHPSSLDVSEILVKHHG